MKELNVKCQVCSKEFHRRPSQIWDNNFCSKKCLYDARGFGKKECEICGKSFKPDKRTSRYCSRSCSNMGRSGIKYSKNSYGNKSRKRLELLKSVFGFNSCMVEGCSYNKTYDVHRLIEGKNGGKYEIGNMFAICPNHHAEVTRNIIKLEKINNCMLRTIEIKHITESQADVVTAPVSKTGEDKTLEDSTSSLSA